VHAELLDRWRRVCEAVGLVERINTVTGPTVVVPRLRRAELGPPLALRVELLPGQVPADVEQLGHRIAPAFGARRLRCSPIESMIVLLELLPADPLSAVVPLELRTDHLITLGRDDSGADVLADPVSMPHAVVQGATRSGKSALLYAVLAQLARRPHTLVAGSDPAGVLWRPWAGRPGASLRVSGLGDVEQHAVMLDALTAQMDSRITQMPDDRDTSALGPDCPLIVCTLDEYAGLLRRAGAKTTLLGGRIRAAVARLLAEGHKAGIRMILVTQRADADVLGGFERSQCELRISFRADGDGTKMLHAGLAPAQLAEHASAPAGVALLTRPGSPTQRLRAPWLGGYAQYRDAVQRGGDSE
jgi:S-DNA-T family DNA segregation ATPase FtsK/SpoIIIE